MQIHANLNYWGFLSLYIFFFVYEYESSVHKIGLEYNT